LTWNKFITDGLRKNTFCLELQTPNHIAKSVDENQRNTTILEREITRKAISICIECP